ncbi:MAG TPA: DUF1922 domain-containing protein [Methanocorpusculum sp.]|nr:DUF1922 domain-containing protein [Methanocorpusculum sp.]
MFGVIGCTKCRRLMVADLSYETKTCQCGKKIILKKSHILARCATADEAGNILRQMNADKNSGFSSADKIKGLGG